MCRQGGARRRRGCSTRPGATRRAFDDLPDAQRDYMLERIHFIAAQDPVAAATIAAGLLRFDGSGEPRRAGAAGRGRQTARRSIGAMHGRAGAAAAAMRRGWSVPGAGHMVPITHAAGRGGGDPGASGPQLGAVATAGGFTPPDPPWDICRTENAKGPDRQAAFASRPRKRSTSASVVDHVLTRRAALAARRGGQAVVGRARLHARGHGLPAGHSGNIMLACSRMQQAAARLCREPCDSRAPMALAWRRQPQPEAVGQIGLHLRGEEAVLGEEVPAPLAAQFELPRLCGVEEHHRLDPQAAVLGAAKRQDVDPRLPGHLGRGRAGGDQRIGKARAVKVAGQALAPWPAPSGRRSRRGYRPCPPRSRW